MTRENDKYKDIFEEVNRVLKNPKDKANPLPQETERDKIFRKLAKVMLSGSGIATVLLFLSSVGSIKQENNSTYDIRPYIREKNISEVRKEVQIQLERKQITSPIKSRR